MASGAVSAAAGSTARRKLSSATNRSDENDPSARCTSDVNIVSVACSTMSTARAAADAGLLSSCASPAASVPSATSASRSRADASMRRTVWNSPSIMWMPNGNHSATSARSASAGTSRTRPGPAPRPVDTYTPAASQARKPPAHMPGVPMTPVTMSSRPTCLVSSIEPSSKTHQPSAGAPSWNNSWPRSNVISVPAAASASSCASSRPSNKKIGRRSSARITGPRRQIVAR